jgi:hypothetical protein
MRSLTSRDASAIVYNETSLAAAKCRKCGAKMYPPSLLTPHLNQHQQKERWFAMELRKLQNKFRRMREFV